VDSSRLRSTNLSRSARRPLNNIIDQEHRGVKRRLRPMLGLKNFGHRTCGNHDCRRRVAASDSQESVCAEPTASSWQIDTEIWNAVLAA
jgi:hypothetical protein